MIRIVATFSLKPDSVADAVKIAQKLIPITREEAGCLDYTLVQSLKDENKVVMLESWDSQAHLDAHSASAHFAEYVPQLANLCSAPPAIDVYTVLV